MPIIGSWKENKIQCKVWITVFSIDHGGKLNINQQIKTNWYNLAVIACKSQKVSDFLLFCKNLMKTTNFIGLH